MVATANALSLGQQAYGRNWKNKHWDIAKPSIYAGWVTGR